MKIFRKAAALAVSTAMALTMAAMPASAAERMYGDVQLDGVVNVLDVIVLNKNLLGGYELTEEQQACADADGNGEVNAADSLTILKYIIHLVENLGPDESATEPTDPIPTETTTETIETTTTSVDYGETTLPTSAETDPTEPTETTTVTDESGSADTTDSVSETAETETTENTFVSEEEENSETETTTTTEMTESTTVSEDVATSDTADETTESLNTDIATTETIVDTTVSTDEAMTTVESDTTETSETTETTEAGTVQATDENGNYNIDITGADSVTVKFVGTPYAGLNGGYGYWDNNAENAEGGTGAWIEGSWDVGDALDELGEGTWTFAVPEGVTSVQLYVNYYAVWSNEANDMVNLDKANLEVFSVLEGVEEIPEETIETLTGTTEERELTTDADGNQVLDITGVEKFQLTLTGGQAGAAVNGYCGYWDNTAGEWVSLNWTVAGECFDENGNAVAIFTIPEEWDTESIQVAVGYYAIWDNDAGAMVDLDKTGLTMSVIVQLAETTE